MKKRSKKKHDSIIKSILKQIFMQQVSYVGLSIGLFFVVLSLTPSLLPRTWLFQGLASGLSLISGYAVGVALVAIWRLLKLREIPEKFRYTVAKVVLSLDALLLIFIMTKVGDWQNNVRQLVGVDASLSTNPFRIVFVAFIFAFFLLILGRIVRVTSRYIVHFSSKFLPPNVALVIGIVLTFWLVTTVVSGAFRSTALRLANNTFSLADRGTKVGSIEPTSELRSGSPQSLVSWQELGKQGRQFIGTGPTKAEISSFSTNAQEPIRVYAGLANGETHKERSEVLLQELIRTKAFERSKLVIATTTGTGYLDPNAVDTFEYVNNGDTAIAGQQYSYLPSWIALLSDTETAKDASIAMFNAIHGYWQKLDEDSRPELYLYGLSLGAYGSQASISRVELLNDPVDGALWAGPPFVSEFWNRITRDRDEDSTAWLPEYQNGQVIRFTGSENSLYDLGGDWQENKIIYMQHATDPVVFFSNDYLFNRPEWLEGERGPGVSPDMRWYPFVTYWQLAFDLFSAGNTAEGFGHLYSAESYIDSWVALTGPEDWTNQKSEELKAIFSN